MSRPTEILITEILTIRALKLFTEEVETNSSNIIMPACYEIAKQPTALACTETFGAVLYESVGEAVRDSSDDR